MIVIPEVNLVSTANILGRKPSPLKRIQTFIFPHTTGFLIVTRYYRFDLKTGNEPQQYISSVILAHQQGLSESSHLQSMA